MKLWKNNSYEIVRLFIYQIGITIFSFALLVTTGFMENSSTKATLVLLFSIFSTGFYLALLYVAGWEYGSKDKVKIDAGRLEKIPAKGALMSLYANLPNLFFIFTGAALMGIYFAAGVEWCKSVYGIFTMLHRFISVMFIGIVQAIFSFLPDGSEMTEFIEGIGYIILPILAVGTTQLGYSLGSRDIRIMDVIKGQSDSKGKK